MTAQIAAHGRLGRDPETRETRTGKTMVTTSLAVDVTGYGAESPETLWLGLVAFGRVAEDLARHAKGEVVSVSGRLSLNRWVGRDGEEHEQLRVTVDSVVSARTVRGGRRKGSGAEAEADPSGPDSAPFDDEMPF